MPATPKRRRGHAHKVLHLSSYARLEEYLAPSPKATSICSSSSVRAAWPKAARCGRR